MPSTQYILMDSGPVRAITSSTDATPIVVTDTSHGLVTGDKVIINGHTTNTNANGLWTITKVNDNSFSLDGSTATGGGAGGATGVWAQVVQPQILVNDAESISVTIDTDGGGDAAMTLKFWSSDQIEPPDPGAPQSASNQYDFVDMIDKEDGTSIDGDEGFVVAGADDHRQFDVNISHARWFGVVATDGTAGEATVKVTVWDKGVY